MDFGRTLDAEEYLAISFYNLPILPEVDDYSHATQAENDTDDVADRSDNMEAPPSKRLRSTHSCEPCGVEYKYKRLLARHFHTDQHRTKFGLPLETSLPCGYCGKTFSRGHDRVRHEREQHLGLTRLRTIGDGITSRRTLQRNAPHLFNLGRDNLATGFEKANEQDETIHLQTELPQSPLTQLIQGPVAQYCRATTKANDEPTRHEDPIPVLMESDAIYSDDRQYSMARESGFEQLHREGSRRTASTKDSGIDMEYDKIDGDGLGESVQDIESVSTSDDAQQDTNKPYRYGVVFDIPIRPIKTLIKAGAKRRPTQHPKPPACKLCYKSLGKDIVECRAHLNKHFLELQGEHMCTICEIGFKLGRDLVRHQQCASGSEPHCGFSFDHNSTCQGHHRPSDVNFGELRSDRFKLLQMLSNWEQAIIQLQLDYVNNLLVLPAMNVAPDAWTAPPKFRQSVVSDRSSMFFPGWRSNPDYVDYQV
jgi:hypothetical protein